MHHAAATQAGRGTSGANGGAPGVEACSGIFWWSLEIIFFCLMRLHGGGSAEKADVAGTARQSSTYAGYDGRESEGDLVGVSQTLLSWDDVGVEGVMERESGRGRKWRWWTQEVLLFFFHSDVSTPPSVFSCPSLLAVGGPRLVPCNDGLGKDVPVRWRR